MDIEYFSQPNVLLIDGHEPKAVALLREQLAELAQGRIGSFAVHKLPGFRSVEGSQLFAERDTWDSGVHPDPKPPVFRCRLTPLTWQNIEVLLEPLSEGGYFGSSHQLLDHHGEVQLIIAGGRGW
ncbi:hypothetical protein FEM03_09130 [Phragmitibacter flavus]|uniref:Uncharacterized protein n=1 Tax=Phragmitibacter flavus TaxID=2576071 RepID=A0A5R8KGI1_9BACT|nr:hypothetical protein [Phragmitibacter flavus]TLD71065.1 hypothetical protein FEM03_09130 [Phragmitibacter flavus]